MEYDPMIGIKAVDVAYVAASFIFGTFFTVSGLIGGIGAWVLYKTRRG